MCTHTPLKYLSGTMRLQSRHSAHHSSPRGADTDTDAAAAPVGASNALPPAALAAGSALHGQRRRTPRRVLVARLARPRPGPRREGAQGAAREAGGRTSPMRGRAVSAALAIRPLPRASRAAIDAPS